MSNSRFLSNTFIVAMIRQRGGTLIMGRQTEPSSLAPWDSTGNGNIFFQMQIYDRLVEQLPGYLEVQPRNTPIAAVQKPDAAQVARVRELIARR